jgi:hypothetical protein
MAHLRLTSCSIIACAASLAFVAGADAGIADFDLADTEYGSSGLTVIGSFQTNAAGTQITGFTLEQGILQTYDNGGLPNWASEAVLGFSVALPTGDEFIYFHLPFAEVDGSGLYGPIDIDVDMSSDGYLVPEDGIITAYALGSWDDGTDSPAGIWLQGDLDVNYLPGPASLALLVLGGMTARRRRRCS